MATSKKAATEKKMPPNAGKAPREAYELLMAPTA